MQSDRYKGITLIELVLYLALFALIILVMVQFFVFVVNKNVNAQNRLELSKNMVFIYQHMESTNDNPFTIDEVNTVVDPTAGKLSIIQDGVSVTYQVIDGRLNYIKNGNILLTIPEVLVGSFGVDTIVNSEGDVISARVTMSLSHKMVENKVEQIEFTFKEK